MRNEKRGATFCQSQYDFPCSVALGNKLPDWYIKRWNGSGLRFVPSDNEGFYLRGDKKRLLYKGRKRSHRFSILSDTAFEYDCILEREPDINVVSLRIEGAEYFDFFRQPDFVKEPFLKGSYAVYKKDTLIGEGTGKLCHIHRPEIIDARGRRCWGDLSTSGGMLHITIPEWWLSEAKYPVVVDPTIGTTTVGSQTVFYDEDNDGWYELFFELSLGVNRFLIPELFNGNATAYVYAYNTNYDPRCKPVLYSDFGNVPISRRSKNEGYFDIEVKSGKPAGWRSANFQTNTSVASGTYLWFGFFCDWFSTKFDYGAKCYRNMWLDDDIDVDIPDEFPMWDAKYFYDFKLSMYFTFASAVQNYVRVLTQGVKLSDNRKIKVDYKRSLTQTVNTNSKISRIQAFFRKFEMTAHNFMIVNLFQSFFRKCEMSAHIFMNINRYPVFLRSVIDKIKLIMVFDYACSLFRKCIDSLFAYSQVSRIFNVFRKVQDYFIGIDIQSFSVLILRSVADNAIVNQHNSHWGSFIRGLAVNAGSLAETSRKTEYYRFNNDNVQVVGTVFRGLLLFVRIVAKIIFRDYLLGRFLRAREELILKSVVCREIILNSKID